MIPYIPYVYEDNKAITRRWLGCIDYNAKLIKLKKTKKPRFVACFTSWSKRIEYCSVLIKSILEKQTLQPDYIFLTLSEQEFPNYEADLPADLIQLIKHNSKVKLVWNGTDNLKTFKKVFPILPILNDEDVIIVLDDDNYDLLPNDIFEKRYEDFKKYNRPITYNLPILDISIWLNGSGCPIFAKYMLNGWQDYIDDDCLMSFNDNDVFTRIMVSNGHYPITASYYYGTSLQHNPYTINDELDSHKNNDYKASYYMNSLLTNSENNELFRKIYTDKKYLNDFKEKFKTGIKLPIAMCECNQMRFDTIFYNAIKSLIISNYFLYDFKFTIFTQDYINIDKVKNLLTAYNIEYEFITEEMVAKPLKLIKSFDLYSGPYNKLVLYEYMKKYDWYLILDDDLIVRHNFYPEIFEDFLKSKKPIGLCDDFQYREVSPVLYTEKYGLEKEYNTGVVLVNNKYFPKNFLNKLKKVNNDYYRENPDMPTNMMEQTPINIFFKDEIYELPNIMNFKPISKVKCPHPLLGAIIYHWAGVDKQNLIRNPNSIEYGWLYDTIDKFELLDSINNYDTTNSDTH